jgi:hypothetical protein
MPQKEGPEISQKEGTDDRGQPIECQEQGPVVLVADMSRKASSPQHVINALQCVACKQEIPVGASLCSHCKSYQHVWKNRLQYVAGIATLLVLVITACSWLYLNAVKPLWYRDDVRLISSNSLRSAVVANRGDVEVFVSHMLLYMSGRPSSWQAKRLEFEEVLPPGKILSRNFPPASITGSSEFVRGLNSAEFEKLLVRASNGDYCFELAFFDANDSFLRDLKKMAGERLNTFEIAGYLEYRGLRADEPMAVPITGDGVLRQDSRPECQ